METPKVIGKNILLQIIEKEEKKGVLIYPAKTQGPRYCKVIDMGSLVVEIDQDDTVVIDNYGGVSLEHDGVNYLVIDQEHVIAIV
jgi:co-chaperonin GroES (HSP10)